MGKSVPPVAIPEADVAPLSKDRQSVIATARYYYDGRGQHASIFAPNATIPPELPLPGDKWAGARYEALVGQRRLVQNHPLHAVAENLFRVVDCFCGLVWQVSFDTGLRCGGVYGQTYVLMPDGKPDPDMIKLPPSHFNSLGVFWRYIAAQGPNAYVERYSEVDGWSGYLSNSEGVVVVIDLGELTRDRLRLASR